MLLRGQSPSTREKRVQYTTGLAGLPAKAKLKERKKMKFAQNTAGLVSTVLLECKWYDTVVLGVLLSISKLLTVCLVQQT